ncbi:MAG TPA: GTA-gp10 family protein [Caulobacterales bacterium]|nr:GTA-gp10 family protein [Caulobacterales bacterium]
MTLPNKVRGEVVLDIDGAPRRLCVTLGALAELEAAFDVASFAELGARLAALTASDLITVISALLQGEAMTPAQIASSRIDPQEAAHAVAEAFRLAFDDA